MADDKPEVKPDPTPKTLSEIRVPDPITSSEKEVFVGRIKELEAEVKDLRAKLEEALKPKRETKPKGILDRFSPLG